MKILMVLTSHDSQGNSREGAGFGLEDFAAPYYVFKDAGALITLASPEAGKPALNGRNGVEATLADVTLRFHSDAAAQAALSRTVPLADVIAEDFDALFYPGGQGSLWDLVDDPHSIALIEAMLGRGKPAAFVGHAAGVLRDARTPEGAPVVEDREVTGFSNTEETAAGLTSVIPFLVEDMLKDKRGRYSKAEDWQPHVVTDGFLVTGQNAASSEPAAQALLKRHRFFSAPGFIATIPWNAS